MPTETLPITFAMPSTPSLHSAIDSAQADAATKFSWTAFTGGIHRLRFEPVSNAGIPVVDVYTSRTTATWPDLKALGTPFPAGDDLNCKLKGFAPFSSMNVATGPYGLTHLNTERREADTNYIMVHAVPKAATTPTESP